MSKNKNKRKKIILKAGILIITALLILSTSAVTAHTSQNKIVLTIEKNTIQDPVIKSTDVELKYYEGDQPERVLGLTSVTTWQAAIRLTPTELTGYNNWILHTVHWFHGIGTGQTPAARTGKIKIYDQGTLSPPRPGTLLTEEPFTAPADPLGWFVVELSSPQIINESKELWISVETVSDGVTSYFGMGSSPPTDLKSQWIYLNSKWQEMEELNPALVYDFFIGGFISEPSPLSADAGGPYQGVIDIPVQFNGVASGGVPPYTFFWQFGDGKNSTEKDPTHTYTTAGTFAVNLTVTDHDGTVASDETTTTVTQESPAELQVLSITVDNHKILNATIKNKATSPALAVSITMKVTGGILKRINETYTGSEATLAGGSTTHLLSEKLFGLGKIAIVVTAKADNAAEVKKETTGFIIGSLIFGVE